MTRTTERIIDLAAMFMMLSFCYLFRESQPALAGLVIGAAIQFWMQKNAASPDSPAHKEAASVAAAAAAQAIAAATAAAQVLRTATTAAETKSAAETPAVEVVKPVIPR
jgi:hypothetical protein